MLLEMAVGDAYGAGFEYVPEFALQRNDLSGYLQHTKYQIQPGKYTDDTQMSLAIAEAIVAEDDWNPAALADRFVQVFHRDPREGYASRFYQFLQDTQTGDEFLANIQPWSERSGAAMRAGPIGVFSDPTEVLEKAALQAKLTHNTPAGIAAAQAAALMSHYFLHQLGDKAALGQFLERQIPGYSWAEPWGDPVGEKGWMAVRAAITAIVNHDRLSEILRACIAFGGDVDTVATIALAAASGSVEVTPDLPQHLVDGLENDRYGRDYLCALDAQLLQKVSLS
ncbi:ADP-ribosylglycohydrolase family protein [Alkalinema sp. FACHB-956]|uniref:ADP-ribosylglycohydrolase family protein n=1 Tax=Alkalinema sp. FACHB-956 TaxID=2692768 RepID=UPI0016827758|nr:ADP-ribosylglycohydrolase family protein [Alkalinema sp. FACHB-956]MBD2326211.1 ADP-ribosylglycohydrolase family protein [Alkalinema sp. FACHB-956]